MAFVTTLMTNPLLSALGVSARRRRSSDARQTSQPGAYALAALVLIVATPLAATAAPPATPETQQAGHATLPVTGAIAPGGLPTADRDADPVIAGIEELRRVLADIGRKYQEGEADRQGGDAARPAGGARAGRVDVTAAHELVASR